CPFCENDDQELLRYFFVENDEAHRIDVCDKCKRYIKTIDFRKGGSFMNLFVENLATLEMDIVADKEGFQGGDIFLSREK
ncbi:MAG: formate dehydrogenase accessory protein FdhE, partial [Spirochaetes bacterium]|nr:formate dehydrogenase accessory protein FdhE [Spirochaetota bacterium]